MHLKPHSKFHDYEILCVLGEGRYSTVYKVKDLRTDELFAMKYVRKEKHLYNEKYVKNEKSLIDKLPKHKNIVEHITVHEEKDYIFFIMEYLNGYTLRREIVESLLHKNFTVSFESKKNYILQVIEGVKKLHENKIYHCDLKPENIVLTGENIKIIDFSCAVVSDCDFVQYKKKCINTTPGYGPPELHDFNKKGADVFLSAVDTWSIGVLIYFVFSGKNPFEEKFVGENYIESKKVDVKYQILQEEIADVCMAIFKDEPAQRLTLNEVEAVFTTICND